MKNIEKKNIENEFHSKLSEYVSSKDTVIAGVSGGPDSTALIYLLKKYSLKTPCKIIVAHVNHGIRGRDALLDEKFVKNLAESLSLKCFVKKAKLTGPGLEEKGRILRREFFENLRKKFGAEWILTAHTLSDQLETVVFNFLRGSGPGGLGGMKESEGFYLKPLLNFPKAEILSYLKSGEIRFRTDKTNLDTRFRRNFVRLEILPMLKKVNPSIEKTLCRNASIFQDIEKWLRAEAEKFLKNQKAGGEKPGFIFLAKDFLKLPMPVRHEVIKISFKKISGRHYSLPFVKIGEVMNLIERNIGKKKICVGSKAAFFLDKGRVFLF